MSARVYDAFLRISAYLCVTKNSFMCAVFRAESRRKRALIRAAKLSKSGKTGEKESKNPMTEVNKLLRRIQSYLKTHGTVMQQSQFGTWWQQVADGMAAGAFGNDRTQILTMLQSAQLQLRVPG